MTTLSPVRFFPSTIFVPYVLMFLKVPFEAIALQTVPSLWAAGFRMSQPFFFLHSAAASWRVSASPCSAPVSSVGGSAGELQRSA